MTCRTFIMFLPHVSLTIIVIFLGVGCCELIITCYSTMHKYFTMWKGRDTSSNVLGSQKVPERPSKLTKWSQMMQNPNNFTFFRVPRHEAQHTYTLLEHIHPQSLSCYVVTEAKAKTNTNTFYILLPLLCLRCGPKLYIIPWGWWLHGVLDKD